MFDDKDFDATLDLIDSTSAYGLTGSMYASPLHPHVVSLTHHSFTSPSSCTYSFASDRTALLRTTSRLRNAAGNIYYNEKCTGAVVGQQPFGGARASGTNDKAGSMSIFYRFVSARSIKENFIPLEDYSYPSNLA